MRRGYCVSSTTNGAWQMAHCEDRNGLAPDDLTFASVMKLQVSAPVPGGTSLG